MAVRLTRTPVNNSDEKKLLIGCIISDTFLGRILPLATDECIASSMAKVMMGWIREYYEKYKRAPRDDFEDMYNINAASLDVAESDLIKKFINEIDTTSIAVNFNEDVYYDRSVLYLKRNSLLHLTRSINAHLMGDDVLGAERVLVERKSIATSTLKTIDVFRDTEPWVRAFDVASTPLFLMPGALGELLNEFLVRDSLLAVLAPEKRGKTFLMFEMAMRAVMARCNVLMAQCGDLSEEQSLERLGIRLTGRNRLSKYCKKHLSPVADCLLNQKDICRDKHRLCKVGIDTDKCKSKEDFMELSEQYFPCTYCKEKGLRQYQGAVYYETIPEVDPLTLQDTYKEVTVWRKRHQKRSFKLLAVPSKTLSMEMLEAHCEILANTENFIPDVVIVDYADIVIPNDSRLTGRDEINNIWISLKQFSQKWHCLVIAPTQANFAANEAELLGIGNFSDDKRKRAHITAEATLNRTLHEKRLGIMRVGVTLGRSGDVDERRTVTLLQDLWRGRPLLDSYWTPVSYKPKRDPKQKQQKETTGSEKQI